VKAAVTLMALVVGPALAGETGETARILTTRFDPDAVVPISAPLGLAFDIELLPGEQVGGVAGGDLAFMDLAAEHNHVVVRARQPVAPTSLIIFTDRHTYRLMYSAGATAELRSVVALRYTPADTSSPAVQPPAPITRHTDYWYCGSSALRPTEAYDDGRHTYVRFPAGVDLPVLYRRTGDGHEQLLNSHIERDWVVIHEVTPMLVVRRDRASGCIERRGPLPLPDAAPRGLP
jgi:type IV secretion system protein VirB9